MSKPGGAAVFLTARWTDLVLVTYRVPPALLEPHRPPGCQLEQQDGDAFASLVAFRFLDTRVLGVAVPGYRDFPEINLRFYVRHGGDRGVAFVRELVPQRLVAWLARLLYNEPYLAAPGMRARVARDGERVTAEYTVRHGDREHRLGVAAGPARSLPAEDSVEHFFKEHRWGFGRDRRGRLLRYEVEHPAWWVRPVERLELDVDFARLYGEPWACLNGAVPHHRLFAEGSPVRVSTYRGERSSR